MGRYRSRYRAKSEFSLLLGNALTKSEPAVPRLEMTKMNEQTIKHVSMQWEECPLTLLKLVLPNTLGSYQIGMISGESHLENLTMDMFASLAVTSLSNSSH